MKIDHLSQLEFLDQEFVYKSKPYRYAEISSISFAAVHTQHRVNFMPAESSYDARLDLHLLGGRTLKIGQEWAFLGKNQKIRMEAVWRAKEVFSEVTFHQRITRYEEELKIEEFFSYDRYQFHRNGNLSKNGRYVLSMTATDVSTSLYPFHICFSRPKSPLQKVAAAFVNLDETIRISRDRDCFLYMLKQMYNIYWPNEEYRARRVPPKTMFFRAILGLGAKMCVADGATGRNELAALRDHFGLTSGNFPEAGAVFNAALRSNEGAEAIARRIKAEITDQRDLLEYILIGLAKIAAADGSYDVNEHEVLLATAAGFGLSTDDLDHILTFIGIRPQFGQKKSAQKLPRSITLRCSA